MTQYTELRKAAESAAVWRNCDQAWETTDKDGYKTATVGHISEDDEKYPVCEIDCAQYYADDDSIKVAQFIALANPATILALLDEREKLLKVVEAAKESLCIETPKFLIDALNALDEARKA